MAHQPATEAAAPRPGRPRSEKTKAAILRAASDLLLDRGLGAISMDAVAERAGAGKATIYRWWPSKELLALDALFSEWGRARPVMPDTGSLREDLLATLRPWVRQLTAEDYGGIIASLITKAHSDPEFGKVYRERFVKPRRDQAKQILTRARERGQVRPDADLEVALDMLYGPLYHRMLHGHAPVNERFARAVVDNVVAAIATPAGVG